MSSDSSSSSSFPTQHQTQSTDEKNTEKLDFMDSIRKVTEDTNQSVYVHPLSKLSSSSLSPRSLEICTEFLGSESGAGIDYSDAFEIDFHHQTRSTPRKTREPMSKKSKPIASFPPPLTSISGIEGVEVRSHREGGRLVIKAFSYTSSGSFLRAERENGRLRISYFRGNLPMERDCNEMGEDEGEDNGEDEDGISEVEGGFWGDENGIMGWSSSSSSSNIIRCNDDSSSGNKGIPSLPFCVAIS